MIRFVVASSAFNLNQDAVYAIIDTFCRDVSSDVIVLDTSTIVKATEITTLVGNSDHFMMLSLASCLINGEADPLYIRTASQNCPVNTIIVLDSIGYNYKLTSNVLMECQRVWFHNDFWPLAFVLLCDETDLHRYAMDMTNFFYIPAENLSDKDLRKKVRRIKQKAWLLHWFGYGKLMQLAVQTKHLKSRLVRSMLS